MCNTSSFFFFFFWLRIQLELLSLHMRDQNHLIIFYNICICIQIDIKISAQKKKGKRKYRSYFPRVPMLHKTVIITMMELCACAVTSTLIQSSMIEFINTTYLFKIVKFSNQPFSIFHYKIRQNHLKKRKNSIIARAIF